MATAAEYRAKADALQQRGGSQALIDMYRRQADRLDARPPAPRAREVRLDREPVVVDPPRAQKVELTPEELGPTPEVGEPTFEGDLEFADEPIFDVEDVELSPPATVREARRQRVTRPGATRKFYEDVAIGGGRLAAPYSAPAPKIVDAVSEVNREMVRFINERRAHYLAQRPTPRNIDALVEQDVRKFRETRYDVEGRPRPSGLSGYISRFVPPFRETMIRDVSVRDPSDPQETEVVKGIVDPQTGELEIDPATGQPRAPTAFEESREAFAQQRNELGDSRLKTEMRQMERRAGFSERGGELALEEYEDEIKDEVLDEMNSGVLKNILTTMRPDLGVVTETAGGTALRANVATTVEAVINEAVFNWLPLFYEQDPETGKPVDPSDPAFRIHQQLVDLYKLAGNTEEEAERKLSGAVNLTTGKGAGVPVPIPFQGIQRAQPTAVDPLGERIASQSGNFIVDVARAVTRGRSTGDEIQSISAYVEDLTDQSEVVMTRPVVVNGETVYLPQGGGVLDPRYSVLEDPTSTVPYWIGTAASILYPGGFFTLGGKGRKAALALLKKAKGKARVPAKVVTAALSPVASANKARVIREAQDLAEGVAGVGDDLDILHDMNEIRKVTGERIAEEVMTPYTMLANLDANPDASIYQMQELAQFSNSGRLAMQRAGLDKIYLSDAPLSVPQKTRLRSTLNTHVASAYKQAALRTLARDDIDGFRKKAEAILDLMEASGVDSREVLPLNLLNRALKTPDDVAAKRFFDEAVDFLRQAPESAVPVAKGKGTLLSLHELGNNLLRIARPDKTGGLRGPAARVISRRLGDTSLTRQLIADDPVFAHRAVAGGAGRLVEATLENSVPDNYVMVTNSLMVPRDRLTNDVYKAVRERVSKYQPDHNLGVDDLTLTEEEQVVRRVRGSEPSVTLVEGADGSPRFQYDKAATDDFIEAVGVDAVRRSPGLTKVVSSLSQGGSLDSGQHNIVQQALLNKAFRDVLGEQAKAPVFQGDQLKFARVPGVSRGRNVRPEMRVPRKPFGRAYKAIGTALDEGRVGITNALRFVARKAGKDADRLRTTFPPNVPVEYGQAMVRVQNELGALGERFQREVRDAAAKPGDRGVAFDKVVGKRVSAISKRARESVDNAASEMIDGGMSRRDAYYTIAYRMGAGEALEGLGVLRTKIPKNIDDIARARAELLARQQAWSDIIEGFFGRDLFQTLADEMLPMVIRRKGLSRDVPLSNPSELVPLNSAGLREVLERLRDARSSLEGRGLSRATLTKVFGKPTMDSIFDSLGSWAVQTDGNLVLDRELRRLRDEAPELFVDLVPSIYGNQPRRIEVGRTFALDTRLEVLSNLVNAGRKFDDVPPALRVGDLTPQIESFFARAEDSKGEFFLNKKGQYQPLEAGKFSRRLDDIGEYINMQLSGRDRFEMADTVFKRLMVEQRPTMSTEDLVRLYAGEGVLDSVRLNKKATYESINRLISDMDNAVKDLMLRTGGRIQMLDDLYGRDPEQLFTFLTRAFDGDQGAAVLYQSILAAQYRGNKDIPGIINDTVMNQLFKTHVAPIVDEMNANARHMGAAPGYTAGDFDNLQRRILDMDVANPRIAMIGEEYGKTIETLQAQIRSGKLTESIDQLKRRDALARALGAAEPEDRASARADLAALMIDRLLSVSRRAAAGGMLATGYYLSPMIIGQRAETAEQEGSAGILVPKPQSLLPMPNMRYLGMNLLTAPLIALATVGAPNAIRMLSGRGLLSQARQVGRQTASMLPTFIRDKIPDIKRRPLPNVAQPKPATTVEFVDNNGRAWTHGEVQEAMSRNNIMLTRGQAEFNESFMAEVMRDAKLLADGTPVGAFRDFLRQIDPTKTSIFQYIANATDKVFRENMFAAGLREGLTEDQAAALARNVVLDYGAVHPFVRNYVNRYILFVTFRAVNTMETIRFLGRDPDTFFKQLRTLNNVNKFNDNQMLGPDYARARPALSKQMVFDGEATSSLYGPGIPAVEAFNDMMDFGSYVSQFGGGMADIQIERGATEVSEQNMMPVVSALIDGLMRKGKRPTDPGYRVPTWVVDYALAQDPEFWVYLKDRYGITAIKPEKRLAGRSRAVDPTYPEMGETEFQFGNQTKQKLFIRDMMLMTYLASQRKTRDATNFGSTLNIDSVNPTALGTVPPLGQATGAMTRISSPDPQRLSERILREQADALRDAARAP
jgi:hypothetical protein